MIETSALVKKDSRELPCPFHHRKTLQEVGTYN